MKQIVCFGDSNTYGLIPGTTDRYDWNTRWTGIVGEEMSRQGVSGTGRRSVRKNHDL